MAVFGIGAALPLILLGLVVAGDLDGVHARLMSAGKFGKACSAQLSS